MYVRFVVGTDAENAAWLNGVITEAQLLRERGDLHGYESDYLEIIFAWFNENLPCPPFRRNFRTRKWTRDAVCWFRPEAERPVGRMWDLVAILREHGVPVRLVVTEKPGKIVYEDEYQVVAETPYWA